VSRLAILGASGHGKVVADAALKSGWKDVVFFDDSWPGRTSNGKWSIVGNTETLLLEFSTFDGVVVGIGDNVIRAIKQKELFDKGATLATIVHPSAQVSSHAVIECGTVILPNAVVNADAHIAQGCIVNSGAVIEHDCVLGEFSHVSPNAVLAGGARVGCRSWVGALASVRQLINIADDCVVGMGAVVIEDTVCGSVVAGIPAKTVR
jgi:sugar O-acyltransferase (sialic acid O-acetyltransferase NeuD family)